MIWLVVGQTLDFGFLTYDDHLFVTGSPQVRAGLTEKSIVWAFTNGPGGEWYPLSMLSHMLDCQIFGASPKSAWGPHLTNVLLHAATTIGLFLFWRSMTGQLWPSALVATLFAIHPQHVESVTWIAERRDVLSGLFFVLTLWAYLGYVRGGRTLIRYSLVALLLALGLMAKAMLVTVPALLVLLDYWPLGRFGQATALPAVAPAVERQSFLRLVVEKLPLAAMALAGAIATIVTHANADTATTLPWTDRLSQAAVALAPYLGQFFSRSIWRSSIPFRSAAIPCGKSSELPCC